MKLRILIAFISMSLIGAEGRAQCAAGQHEVSFSMGKVSGQQLFGSSWGGSGGYFIRSGTPNYFLTYRYYVGGRFAVGVTAGVQDMSGDYEDDNGRIETYTKYHYTTVASEFLFNYKNGAYYRLYSYLGLGCSVHTQQETAFAPGSHDRSETLRGFNLQYVPFGVSFGGKLSLFVELGVGYKGLLNAGVSFRFPSIKPAKWYRKSHW